MHIRRISMLCLAFISIFFIGAHDFKLNSLPSRLKTAIANWEQKHHAVIQCALDKCKVPYSKCVATYHQIAKQRKARKRKAKVDKQIPKNIVDLVYEVAADFGISRDELSIIHDTSHNSEAWVRGMNLYINPKKLSQYSDKAQRYIIGHEMSHIVHDDCNWRDALNHARVPKSELNTIIKAQEAKADFYAYTRGPVYAQGGVECYEHDLKIYGNGGGRTHPCNLERLQLAKQMVGTIAAAAA